MPSCIGSIAWKPPFPGATGPDKGFSEDPIVLRDWKQCVRVLVFTDHRENTGPEHKGQSGFYTSIMDPLHEPMEELRAI